MSTLPERPEPCTPVSADSAGDGGPVSIQPLGDSAVILSWPECPDDRVGRVVHQTATRLNEFTASRTEQVASFPGFLGIVPAFASVTVHYSPLVMTWDEVVSHLHGAMQQAGAKSICTPRVVEIPVCYAPPFADDLMDVAAAHGLSAEDVIRLHLGAEYTVRMIGFSPGFPYLAGLPAVLHTPRLKTPRLRVPAGSVAIGGRQTGIYSLETPGGWNIIGRTPVAMFRPDLDPPCFLNVGDRVRFVEISADEYHDRKGHAS